MKLLALDGNSIVNRAFYGIKLLTTKNGEYYTNAIQGFFNILLKLKSEYNPEAVAIAFDVKQPTFRHKMYDGYKANRHGMPPELAAQMPILKELLSALGYIMIEAPGFEADDILGTLAFACKDGDECYIATGDRDSLQLVSDKVTVLLASTKMGAPQTVVYTPDSVKRDYTVSNPAMLIDVKALQGDTSDCIPGVAGIGPKTAQELISTYNDIDYIYAHIDELDIKKGVKEKLIKDRENAYLSKVLGTISHEAPIDTEYKNYLPLKSDNQKAIEIFSKLEMFKLIERLSLTATKSVSDNTAATTEKDDFSVYEQNDLKLLLSTLKKDGKAYFTFDDGVFCFKAVNGVAVVNKNSLGYSEFYNDFLNDDKIEKYTYNCKKLFYAFDMYYPDIDIKNIKDDVMLSSYLLNPSQGDYSLKRTIGEYAGVIYDGSEDLLEAKCVYYLPKACKKLAEEIKENGQEKLLNEIEIPLSQVLAGMEYEGFAADKEAIEAFGNELSTRIDELTKEIFGQAQCEFNINSPKQLGEVLFEKMGLPALKKTKSGYSTKAEVLEELSESYPVVASILEYRTLTKLKSTYCEGLSKAIGNDGRIHSKFNQVDTRTGRISSSEPNLQNIPVRSELGSEMRKFFTAGNGKTLIDADYSQIELRVLAALSNDENMITAFNNGDDIHKITASQVFGLPLQMVTPDLRSKAKAVNFGIVYGIGAFSLSKQIKVPVYEAKRYITGYLNNFYGIDSFMKNTVAAAKEKGYVETVNARRRYLPEINSTNGLLRQSGERIAMNMPIQGTAADIIKIAMIKVFNALRIGGYKSKLILQIHDELIIEALESEKLEVSALLKREMEAAAELSVKLQADVGIGKTWYEAKK